VRDKFFLTISILMLVFVVVGFAPSFYLRSFLVPAEELLQRGQTLPTYLIVHGTVLTGWYLLACVQPILIATGHVGIHRRIGVFGLFLAICVIVFGAYTQLLNDFILPAANLWSLTSFLGCVALGIYFRHRPSAHKRLMLCASIAIVAPALDRFGRLFLSSLMSSDIPLNLVFALIVQLALLLSVPVYDLATERRITRGTVWGLVTLFVFAPLATGGILRAGAWDYLVNIVR
jgi:hypothetical protein